MLENPILYVVTGGPGVGKTTILRELAERGFCYVPEVARQIIQEQMSCGGNALPWANQSAYAELMLDRSILSFKQHTPSTKTTFCDRGIPDTLCYLKLIGKDTAKAASASLNYRYAQKVFLAPAWEEIYTCDAERRQSWDEAVKTSELMLRVYRECGYEVIELPRATPVERAEFILQHVKSAS
jgi:predicted ATPase